MHSCSFGCHCRVAIILSAQGPKNVLQAHLQQVEGGDVGRAQLQLLLQHGCVGALQQPRVLDHLHSTHTQSIPAVRA